MLKWQLTKPYLCLVILGSISSSIYSAFLDFFFLRLDVFNDIFSEFFHWFYLSYIPIVVLRSHFCYFRSWTNLSSLFLFVLFVLFLVGTSFFGSGSTFASSLSDLLVSPTFFVTFLLFFLFVLYLYNVPLVLLVNYLPSRIVDFDFCFLLHV